MIFDLDKIIESNKILTDQFLSHYVKHKDNLSRIESGVNLQHDYLRIKSIVLGEVEPSLSNCVRLPSSVETDFVSVASKNTRSLFSYIPMERSELAEDFMILESRVWRLVNDKHKYFTNIVDFNVASDPAFVQSVNKSFEYLSAQDLALLYNLKSSYLISDVLTVLASCPKIVCIVGVSYFFSKLHGIIYDTANKVFINIINVLHEKAYVKNIAFHRRIYYIIKLNQDFFYKSIWKYIGLNGVYSVSCCVWKYVWKAPASAETFAIIPEKVIVPKKEAVPLKGPEVKEGIFKTIVEGVHDFGYVLGTIPSTVCTGIAKGSTESLLRGGADLWNNTERMVRSDSVQGLVKNVSDFIDNQKEKRAAAVEKAELKKKIKNLEKRIEKVQDSINKRI